MPTWCSAGSTIPPLHPTADLAESESFETQHPTGMNVGIGLTEVRLKRIAPESSAVPFSTFCVCYVSCMSLADGPTRRENKPLALESAPPPVGFVVSTDDVFGVMVSVGVELHSKRLSPDSLPGAWLCSCVEGWQLKAVPSRDGWCRARNAHGSAARRRRALRGLDCDCKGVRSARQDVPGTAPGRARGTRPCSRGGACVAGAVPGPGLSECTRPAWRKPARRVLD